MSVAPIRTLVVDDDAGARALHGRFVDEAPGFTLVGTAGTGEDAVARVRRGGVDLVLLDMQMPGISGIEVLHRFHQDPSTAPAVLVISSARDQVTVRQALSGRIAGYLVKPFTQEALATRLRSLRDDWDRDAPAERDHPLGQGDIDRMLGVGRIAPRTAPISVARPVGGGATDAAGAPTSTSGIPVITPKKGISEVTLRQVLAALDHTRPTSSNELAERCQISRATARRYLDHLVRSGAISLSHRYGARGRPEVLYRLAVPPVDP